MPIFSGVRMLIYHSVAFVIVGAVFVVLVRAMPPRSFEQPLTDSSLFSLSNVPGFDFNRLGQKEALGYLDLYRSIDADLRKDLPFRAGMTVKEVQRQFAANEAKVEVAMAKWRAETEPPGKFVPPPYADPDNHLYAVSEMSRSPKLQTFLFNGRHQFWMSMAIENGRVKNIYIAPGNLSYLLPAFLIDGEGPQVGHVFGEDEVDPAAKE